MGTHFICTKGLACWIWSLLTVGICRTLFLSLVQGERRVIMIECFHEDRMEGLEEWGGGMIFFLLAATFHLYSILFHEGPGDTIQGLRSLSDMSPATVCQVYLLWVTAGAQRRRRVSLAHLCVRHCSSWARGGGPPVAALPLDHSPLSVEHFWV